MNQISIVHVPSVAVYAQFLFDEVIQSIRAGQSQYLTDLTAKPQSDIAESVYKVFSQTNQPFVS